LQLSQFCCADLGVIACFSSLVASHLGIVLGDTYIVLAGEKPGQNHGS
jgi:hypothetical protein